MKKIETEIEFEEVLLLEKAMLFIFFEWSGSAHIAKKVLSEWESKSKLEVPLFEVEPDESESISKWVRDKAKERGGHGSLVWLKSGTILSVEYDAKNLEFSEIERKTVELFGW